MGNMPETGMHPAEEPLTEDEVSDTLEAEVERQLELVPQELRDQWIERFDGAHNSAALEQLRDDLTTFLQRRSKALAVEHRTDIGREAFVQSFFVQELAPTQQQELREAISEETELIGSGKLAHVYECAANPHLCYKVIYNTADYGLGNDIGTECSFLVELRDLEVDGARTPRPFYYLDQPNKKAILMERIHGVSLKDIIEHGQAFPDTFDFADFFKSLTAYIDEMHERGIHHRDLHGGNIMIDAETGKPRVIDFGFARSGLQLADSEIYAQRVRTQSVPYITDASNLKFVRRQILNVWKTRQLG